MENNDKLKHLASTQFGAITGPSDAELADIELESAEDPYYTPERTEDFRERFSGTDPNYTALRRSRAGLRESGKDSFDISPLAEKAQSAANESAYYTSSEVMGGGKGTVNVTDFDPADFRPAMRGSGAGNWGATDEEGRPLVSASPFEKMKETRAGRQAVSEGEFLLRTAGPTCNHPRCQAIRAKAYELLAPAISKRAFTSRPVEERFTVSETPIPSVRTDVQVPFARVRPESRGKEKLVGSYGTGGNADYGDFEMLRKKGETVPVAEYKALDTAHPAYQKMLKDWQSMSRSGSQPPIFHPDDYLEHHHAPGEELAPLPWES